MSSKMTSNDSVSVEITTNMRYWLEHSAGVKMEQNLPERRSIEREHMQEWGELRQIDAGNQPPVTYSIMIEDISDQGAGFYCQYEIPMGARWLLTTESGGYEIEVTTVWGHLDEGFYRYGALTDVDEPESQHSDQA